MARNNNRGRNNNPSGRNQYSNDWTNSIKERPIAAGSNEEAWARNRNAHTAIVAGATR